MKIIFIDILHKIQTFWRLEIYIQQKSLYNDSDRIKFKKIIYNLLFVENSELKII